MEFDYLFKEIELNSTEKIKGKSIKCIQKHKTKLTNRFDSLKEIMPIIKKNETIHLISSDNFGSIELLKYFIDNYNISEFNITTWSINQGFINLIKTIKTKIIFFVDVSLKSRKSHLYNQIAELAIDGHLQLKLHYKLHSKVTLIKTNDLYISIESSANYSENTRIENFTITENKDVFNFHKNWMNEIIKNQNG